MYEQMRNEILMELDKHFDTVDLNIIGSVLDKVSRHYTIGKGCTELAVIDTVGQKYMNAYLVCKKIEGLASGTLNNYRLGIRSFLSWINKPLDKVTANDVRVYLAEYQSHRKIGDRSLDKQRQYLHCFFEWLAGEEYIPKNCMSSIKPIKFECKQRNALTIEQLERLRNACTNIREKLLVELLYSTACRISEISGLKVSDINLSNKTATVLGKGKKQREVMLSAKTKLLLEEWLKVRKHQECEYLFFNRRGEPIHSGGLREVIKKVSINAGYKTTPHVIRHTTATIALKNGMPIEQVQKMLGHANIATTMIYAEVDDVKLKYDHERFVN